jgi:ribosomal protein S18 acetylase RimI-like enzyme
MEIRPLDSAGWPAAAVLLTRAFLHEPYVIVQYGDDRVRRESVLLEHYRSEDPARFEVVLAAYDGDSLLGLLQGSLAGRCLACTRQLGTSRPEDPEAALEWEFRTNQAEAHATQAEHGHVGKLGVDPDAQGRGVGLALLAAFASQVRDAGGELVLLECQPHRDAFYERAGYERALQFPDPVGPDASLMRLRL